MLKGRATALHPLRAHLHIHVRIPLSQTRIVDYDVSESEVSDLFSRQEHGNEPTMMRPYMLCVVGQPEDEVLDRHGAQHAPPTLMVACGEEMNTASASFTRVRDLSGSISCKCYACMYPERPRKVNMGRWDLGHHGRQHMGVGRCSVLKKCLEMQGKQASISARSGHAAGTS